MSDVDNQGSLPSHVEHGSGRSARAKDTPSPGPEDGELTDDGEPESAHENASAARAPFEPSTGAQNDPTEEETR
ncbi:hypothetical protein [Microbacterium jejuense]|uniref:hypothetical protein n=1 Tax=Microbacterium jejuense TaxID=1263637 RepID=UPI0031EB869E